MLEGMSVRGSLATMPAEDLLAWAADRRVAAPVTFERGNAIRSVVVEDGSVLWASSNLKAEQLGTILVRSGLLGERALADALETRAETGVPLAKVLLMSGLVGEVELVAVLATKIRETVTEVLAWTEGTFELVPRPHAAATGIVAPLPIEICLTVARRRAARMREIETTLGGDDAVFYVPPSAAPPLAVPGTVVDPARAWVLAGERRAAGDIAATFGGERYATLDALATMVDAGRLVIDRRQRARTNSALELAAGARGRLRAGDRAGALAMASQALHQDPSDADVRRTFQLCERARVAEVAKTLLGEHRVPRRIGEITPAMNLGEAEHELAARVDGRWDLLSLVRTGNRREAEALLAFARLADAGVIALGERG